MALAIDVASAAIELDAAATLLEATVLLQMAVCSAEENGLRGLSWKMQRVDVVYSDNSSSRRRDDGAKEGKEGVLGRVEATEGIIVVSCFVVGLLLFGAFGSPCRGSHGNGRGVAVNIVPAAMRNQRLLLVVHHKGERSGG